MNNFNIRINDDSIQQYYLPTKKDQAASSSADLEFRQLLQQKINLATQLNGAFSDSNNNLLPTSMLTSFLSVMNGLSPMQVNPYSSMNQVMPFSGSYTLPFTTQSTVNDVNSNVVSPVHTISSSSSTGATKFDAIIREAAQTYNVDEKLIHSIIKMESNYNPNAKSHAGAVGLMQLMPLTAKYLGVTNRYDIRQNIFGGTKYISEMLQKYNGDLKLALAAYNAGPGNVKKYGGVPPFKETQNYIRKVLEHYFA